MIDSFRHKGLRKKLVEIIRRREGISEKVLAAIGAVPRHFFMDSTFLDFAYEDNAFPISAGQTISQPYTVAFQTELLNIGKGDKILEIGTGSGYQACVLIEMGAKVFSIERQKVLFNRVKEFLPSINYNPKLFYGDGYKGLTAFAPFDKVLITAGADSIPQALIDQLKIGGILVAPIGKRDIQIMTKIVKITETDYEKSEHGTFRFVPLLKDKAKD